MIGYKYNSIEPRIITVEPQERNSARVLNKGTEFVKKLYSNVTKQNTKGLEKSIPA